MDVLVLQHVVCEPPGEFEDVLTERGARIHRVELDEGEPLPQGRSFDAIVAMGGPMSVNDEAELPGWSARRPLSETRWSLAPRFGAHAWESNCSLRVSAPGCMPARPPRSACSRSSSPTRGAPIRSSPGCRRRFPTLQWHGDTFDLPAGAVRLASSPAYPNQAFRYGPRAYGVQFHVEVSEAMAAEWGQIPEYVQYAQTTLGDGGYRPAAGRLLGEPRRDARTRAHDVRGMG